MLSKDVQSYNIAPVRKACTEIRIKQSHLPTVSHACQVLQYLAIRCTTPLQTQLLLQATYIHLYYTMLALGVTAKIVATLLLGCF